MNILLDIFLILLFMLITITSTERGFVNSVWSTVTLIGSFILAYTFSGYVGNWICTNFVLKYISEYAYEIVESLIQQSSEQYDISVLFEALPDEFVNLVKNCGADLSVLETQFGSSINLTEGELSLFAKSVALPISGTISNAIAIVLVFVISLIVLWLIGLLFKVIVKIPIIKTINTLLGFIVGLLKGFIIVWIVCVTLSIFVERGFMNPDSADILNNLTNGSYVFKFFCYFSPIKFINIS